MQTGDTISADDGGDEYRLEELVHSGRSRQVVRCRRVADDVDVAARAIALPSEEEDAEVDAEQRREGLRREEEFLELGIEGIPEGVDTVEVETVDGGREPVLIVDWVGAQSVHDRVAKRPPGTFDAAVALETVRRVAKLAKRVHEAGWVLRDLDPGHVAGDEDVVFVGTGNPTPLDDAPLRGSMVDYDDAPYVAPEVRNEYSGETLAPHADAYGLAALLSYMLTGIEPLAAVESPLTTAAYQRLQDLEPDGLARLVAAGLQPVAKHRVADLDWWIDVARPGELPETRPGGEEFEPLPAPWSGARPPDENRAARSSLSPGPLISVDSEDHALGDDGDEFPAALQDDGGPVNQTDPVQEFLGGGEDEEPEGPREISMLEENLGDGGDRPSDEATGPEVEPLDEAETEEEYWERRAEESPLPPLEDLPFKVRVTIGVVIPLLAMLTVMVLGLLGVL